MKELLEQAKAAKPRVAALGTEEKNRGLLAMADSLEAHAGEILKANAEDLTQAQGKISDVMLDRLRLTEGRIQAMAQGIRQVAALPDPVGLILDSHTRPDGLKIDKVSVPMGVIAIIYESRPNVTSDAAALTLKSGNVCVLRGGKEAIRSATAIVDALRAGLRQAGIPEDAVNLVQDTSRDSATALMTADGYVDLLIPRGGAGLISACVRTATVPCIATGTGICHVYVEKTADQDMALNIIENAKTSRPSVCNAEEVLLVDRAIAPEFLPKLYARIGAKVELRLDGEPVNLTRTEYDILKLLMEHPGEVYSPKQIYEAVWKGSPCGVENTVAVHIRHLREKLEYNPAEPRYLKVVWGRGYKMEDVENE